MGKLKAVIIDDESLAREIIKRYLGKNEAVEIAAECSNGFEGVKAINEMKPDIVFLDIQMPKITGFEMLELLDEMPVVIFTTAFDQFALKAFEVNATDYLLKPFSEERFNEALSKAISLLKERPKSEEMVTRLLSSLDEKKDYLSRIVVKSGPKIDIVPAEKILWLEAQDDYVMIHSHDGRFLKQKTMKYFEDHLDPADFIRIHRSYIVRLNIIKQIELFEKETYHVILNDGTTLPVSKSGYSKLKEIFN